MSVPPPSSDPLDKSPALDSAFPSIALMAVAVAVAVGLVIFCGWKIILLEEEKADVDHERLLLERDRDAFLTYGSQLPQLKDEHRVTTEALAMLDEQRKMLEKDIGELTSQREELNTETRSLSGSVTSLQAQIQAQNTELAQGATEMDKMKPAIASLRKELELLRAQEKSLRESILQKRKEEANLMAVVAGLDRTRAQAEEFVARIQADKAMYASMQKDFSHILATFEAVVGKAGSITDEYVGKLDDIAKVKEQLDRSLAVMDADVQSLAAQLDNLKQDRATQTTLLKQGQEQAKLLQTHVEGVAAGNKKFAAAMESVQGLDKKLQAALAAEVKAISRLTREDAETRAELAAAAQSLTQSAEGIRKDQAAMKATDAEVSSLLQQQRTELNQLRDLATEVVSNAEKNHETALAGLKAVSSLNETAQNLNGQAEKLQARLDLAETQGNQMEKLLEAERERLSDLLQAARDMRQQLSATQHREEAMQAALAEILALLRRSAPSEQSHE